MTGRIACLFSLLILCLCSSAVAALEHSGEVLGSNPEAPYTYVRLTIRNMGGVKASYRVEFGDYASKGRVRLDAAALEPGQERIHNVAVPFMQNVTATITDTLGDRANIGLVSYSKHGKRFLNISEIENFAAEKELDDFSKQYAATVSGYGSPSASMSSSDRVLAQIEGRNLAQDWLCYAPFHAVFVRQSVYSKIEAAERATLLRWVDVGGTLIIYNAETDGEESRMFGTIRTMKDSPITSAITSFPAELRRHTQSWQQAWRSGGGGVTFPYGVEKPQGRTGAFIITTAFLLLAGPLNYYHFKRRGRIRMLTVSLPAISIAFCVLITIFFIATQGFARRGGTVSLTALDEASDTAITFARHSLYSGLYPLGGFKFSQDTAFVPVQDPKDFDINITGQTHLQSGLFLPTTNFQYMSVTPQHHARERLIYDPQQKTVINGFEKPLEAGVIYDDGRFLAHGALPAGQKATLQRVAETDVPPRTSTTSPDDRLLRLLELRAMSPEERQVMADRFTGFAAPILQSPGVKYAVLMTQNPANVQPGVKIDAPRNCNVVIGSIADTGTTSTATGAGI